MRLVLFKVMLLMLYKVLAHQKELVHATYNYLDAQIISPSQTHASYLLRGYS
jgi:hypothetical protein